MLSLYCSLVYNDVSFISKTRWCFHHNVYSMVCLCSSFRLSFNVICAMCFQCLDAVLDSFMPLRARDIEISLVVWEWLIANMKPEVLKQHCGHEIRIAKYQRNILAPIHLSVARLDGYHVRSLKFVPQVASGEKLTILVIFGSRFLVNRSTDFKNVYSVGNGDLNPSVPLM